MKVNNIFLIIICFMLVISCSKKQIKTEDIIKEKI